MVGDIFKKGIEEGFNDCREATQRAGNSRREKDLFTENEKMSFPMFFKNILIKYKWGC